MPLRMKYEVVWDEEDEEFVARCVEILGCTGTGKTEDDAIEDCMDTVDTYLEYERELFGRPRRIPC